MANVTSASWIFSRGYEKENKWGLLNWKNWASNLIEKKETNNSDFHIILAIKQGIEENFSGVMAGKLACPHKFMKFSNFFNLIIFSF